MNKETVTIKIPKELTKELIEASIEKHIKDCKEKTTRRP
jgi:hypothetical protein